MVGYSPWNCKTVGHGPRPLKTRMIGWIPNPCRAGGLIKKKKKKNKTKQNEETQSSYLSTIWGPGEEATGFKLGRKSYQKPNQPTP